MTLTRYACDHCGTWQRWFDTQRPPSCPVCVDVRNALPPDGFAFHTLAEAQTGRQTTCERIDDRLEAWSARPALGLGSSGWVVTTDAGRIGLEATGVYTSGALDALADAGGLVTVASTHVHGYGALWQLAERFDPEVLIHRDDLVWTGAFDVTWPMDDLHEVGPGLVAHATGGHFPGHVVFHDAVARRLFCGDALKVDVDEAGRPVALSSHKAYHQRIPLSRNEVSRYRDVIGGLDFTSVCTPFEAVDGVHTDLVVRYLDGLLAGRPTVEAVSVTALS